MYKEDFSSFNNKKQLEILFESNPFPMWIYDLESLKFLAVNNAAVEKYGYSNEKFCSLTIKDIRPKVDVEKLIKNIEQETLSYQWSSGWKHIIKDGSVIDVEIISHEILYNRIKARLVVVNDVTERRRIEENFKLVIESSPSAMVLTNQEGTITLVNKQIEKLTGYSSIELIGKPLDVLIPSRYRHSHVKHEINYHKNPSPRNISERRELYCLHKNGREIPVEIGLNPVKTKDGISVLASLLDISERKRAQEELVEAEKRYRSALEHMTEGFQILGKDFRYLYINKAASEQGRKSINELLGRTMMEVYPGIENTVMFSMLLRCLEHIVPVTMENEFAYPNGDKRWFHLNMEPVPEGILILSRDITHEKQADEELHQYRSNLENLVIERTAQLEEKTKELNAAFELQREREENLKLIFESINDYAIILLDVNGYINSWNTGAEKFTLYRQDDILGKHFSILFPIEDQLNDLPKKELETAIIEERSEVEGWRIKKDGNRFWSLSIINVLRDKSGNISGFIKILKDMTERKIAAEKLKDHSIKLEELNKELESFSYSVSHDLRAPLRHIDGFIQLIEKDIGTKLSDKNKKYFNYITSSVKKMGLLIDDLLSFSRMGRSEMHESEINPEELVNECIKDLIDETKDRDINWKINKLPKVHGDRNLLMQVFINLISNAVKYTKKKEKAVIEIGAKSAEGKHIFYIKDNGAGFDMNYASKLFGVFQRLHSDSEYEGTGIGLANVKRIINRHGGKVWAEGIVNNGAVFYFTLNKK